MRLWSDQVVQPITPRYARTFLKEVWRIDTPEPCVVVRKRLPSQPTLAPLLLIHGFGQNRNAWHLPQRSFANHLAEAGFDVFNVDLRGHGRSGALGARRASGVDDYIRDDLPAVLRRVLELSGHPRAFLVGHSLGGLCSAAVGASLPALVAGVVVLAPPHALGRGHFVLGHLLRGLARSVGHTGVLRGSRIRMPVDLIGRALQSSSRLWDHRYAPLPVRVWQPGSFSPQELRSYLGRSFDVASLGTVDDLMELALRGELRSRRDGTSYTRLMEQCRLPRLVVCGENDLLANPAAVRPAFERSQSVDKRYEKVAAGHGDLLVGRHAPLRTWPLVTEWLRERVPLLAATGWHYAGDNSALDEAS